MPDYSYRSVKVDYAPADIPSPSILTALRADHEYDVVQGAYSVEMWTTPSREERDAAIASLAQRHHIDPMIVAHYAARDARSYDLQMEYEAGLG